MGSILPDSADAALQSFANNVTFGLAPKATALLASKMYGVPYAVALDAVNKRNDQLASDHPYMNAAGFAGGLVSGGAIPEAVGLSGAKTAGGRFVQNALFGAGASAADEAATTGQIDARTGLAALGGAAAGGVGGRAAETVGNLGLNIAQRVGSKLAGSTAAAPAWRFMAKKLGVDANDLAQRYQDYVQNTGGARPALAQLLTSAETQKLRGVASGGLDLGNDIRQYAGQVAQNDVSAGALTTARDRTMNQIMGADAGNGVAVRDLPVNIGDNLLTDPNFARAVRANPDIRLEIANSYTPGQGATASLNSVDRLRSALNDLHDGARGGPYRGLRDQLVQSADSQVPGYANLIQNYGEASKGIEGFKYGMSGQGDLQATGAARAALDTPAGQQGFGMGQTTLAGQNAVKNAVPNISQWDENLAPGTTELARGAAHIMAGSLPLGIFHTVRGILPHLSVADQAIVSRGLLSRDPAVVQDTIQRMGAAGATNDQINQIAATFGGNMAGDFGSSKGVTGVGERPAAPSNGKPNFYYADQPSGGGQAASPVPAAPTKPTFYYGQ